MRSKSELKWIPTSNGALYLESLPPWVDDKDFGVKALNLILPVARGHLVNEGLLDFSNRLLKNSLFSSL